MIEPIPFLPEPARTNNIKHSLELWISPEIERRKKLGLHYDLSWDFCLVILSEPPIVVFDKEMDEHLQWSYPPYTSSCYSGEDHEKTLYFMSAGVFFYPPIQNNIFVPYMFFHRSLGLLELDCNPDNTNPWFRSATSPALSRWGANRQHMQLTECLLHQEDRLKSLSDMGLWVMPRLMYQPMFGISTFIKNGITDKPLEMLLEFCTPDFLNSMIKDWCGNQIFKTQENCWRECLANYKDGRYRSVVNTLIPCIEGVITDALPLDKRNLGIEGKIKAFQNLSSANQLHTNALDFILKGAMLDSFRDWKLEVKKFPNRHALCHGKYEESYYTALSALQCFMLLDSIYYCIMFP